MPFIEFVGLVAGICTSAAALPQIITTIKTRQAKDVSYGMFLVLLAGNCLWVYYGLSKSDLPIILTNSVTIVLDLTMLGLKIKYCV